jgi:hypothetical protein
MHNLLPRDFDFYHLGRITLSDEPTEIPAPLTHASPLFSDDRIAVAFALQGDTPGALVLLLDGSLDVSTYSEAGNIIASRLATSLASREGREVTVSPPRVISRERLQQMLNGGAASARTYLHQQGQRTVRLTALVLEARTGNA